MKGATPALVALERAGIAHQVHRFAESGEVSDSGQALGYGLAAAHALGVEPDRVFKTLLVTVHGGRATQAVGIVPVSKQLSLKALALALGAKKADMLDPRDAERLTGYVVGGISPFGQRKLLPTVIDVSSSMHETIFVSGGRRGVDVEIAPTELVGALTAIVAEIAA